MVALGLETQRHRARTADPGSPCGSTQASIDVARAGSDAAAPQLDEVRDALDAGQPTPLIHQLVSSDRAGGGPGAGGTRWP